ncbi:MAG: hypothetical protein IJH82_04020 [Lachnospiraceae bacterium]|nr:hypothetical protein [Lachnospiraceae bacterium]
MKVNTVGYYKEMSEVKADANSIFDYIHKEEPENIEKICKYLDSGVALIVVPGVTEDVISPEKGNAGVASEYTDGTWLWRGDLSYYVRNYRLKLPDEFIDTMRKNNWMVPISSDNLDSDSLEIDGIKVY